jgi:putative Mn2+ efflux pump MntP
VTGPPILALLGLALALGLDSLRATIGLGVLRPSLGYAVRLALAFALVESATPLVGLFVGSTLAPLTSWASFAGPAVLAATGLYITIESLRGREGEAARVAESRGLIWGLPLSLSLDNLLAGTGLGLLGADPLPAALVIGAISGLLAFGGLRLGAMLPRLLASKAEVVGGLILIASAGATLAQRGAG